MKEIILAGRITNHSISPPLAAVSNALPSTHIQPRALRRTLQTLSTTSLGFAKCAATTGTGMSRHQRFACSESRISQSDKPSQPSINRAKRSSFYEALYVQ